MTRVSVSNRPFRQGAARAVLAELDVAGGQRIVEVQFLAASALQIGAFVRVGDTGLEPVTSALSRGHPAPRVEAENPDRNRDSGPFTPRIRRLRKGADRWRSGGVWALVWALVNAQRAASAAARRIAARVFSRVYLDERRTIWTSGAQSLRCNCGDTFRVRWLPSPGPSACACPGSPMSW